MKNKKDAQKFGSFKKYLSLYQNPPLCANYWGSVVKEQLRKINPARVRYTEFKPPQGGFIYKEQTMDKKKVIVYVDGYNFYYGLKMVAFDKVKADGLRIVVTSTWGAHLPTFLPLTPCNIKRGQKRLLHLI